LVIPTGQDRLYKDLARVLREEIGTGKYPVASRLPPERELAIRYKVSRPTVREAIIALEVQGFVEVRLSSGTYVVRAPGQGDLPGFNISAFELTEARLLFEGEAAALAATQITDEEIQDLERLVEAIACENSDPSGKELADQDFHLAIARATRNAAIHDTIAQLWALRSSSPEAALLHAKARTANVKPVVHEHSAILAALRQHDPAAARAEMRNHLGQVIDNLLFATEAQQIEDARKATQVRRERYARITA